MTGCREEVFMELRLLPFLLSVCKVADAKKIDLTKEFYFIGRTSEEVSLVCRTEDVPADVTERDDGWRGFYIPGVLDFSLTGILAGIANVLADHQISLFAVSTYNTDYVLVKLKDLGHAVQVLEETGYQVTEYKSLETERLLLRRWKDSDAEDLFRYASDPEVGPITGWPPHQNIEESRDILRRVLSAPENYAICLKEDGRAIGTIELMLNGHTDLAKRDDECEMGFWLGRPFWGRGIMPEAVQEMLRHAFEDCGMQKVWCGYYEGNDKSRRVQEKCGFRYQWTTQGLEVPLLHETRTVHVNMMTKEDWLGMQ